MTDAFEIPIFALKTVLYPSTTLPLHIFEERYKKMISDCSERGEPFGVALIESGSEVGEPAITYPVGTLGRITEMIKMESGRMNIVVRGDSRFEIVRFIRHEPYPVALVTALPEVEDDEASSNVVARAHILFNDYVKAWRSLGDSRIRKPGGFLDATTLSYHIASQLQVGDPEKQELLAFNSSAARLRRETKILTRELYVLRIMTDLRGKEETARRKGTDQFYKN